jgi:FAD/FMN-containing dehydrogenase
VEKQALKEIKGVLEKIVGPDRVTDSEAVCQGYQFNPFLGKKWVMKPDMVVMAETTEQVSQILKAANRYKVPITPKGAIGLTGVGGALKGGILLDLALMDKIISIDVENMKAVAEAGCSFYKLAQELFKKGLMLPTPTWYCGASLAGSALLPSNGIGKTRYGPDIDLVEGFEVVLPSGEVVNVGSMAYANTNFGPFYRYIYGPDLVGLFAKSNGVFGIVTKVAHYCLRLPRHWAFHTYYWPREEIQPVTRAMLDSTALEMFDVHLNDRWRWLREGEPVPDDCYFTLTYAVNADNETELKGKEQSIHDVCRAQGGKYFPGFAEYFHIKWPTGLLPGYPRKPLPPSPPGVKTITYNLEEFIYPVSKFPVVYEKIEEYLKNYGIWDGSPLKPVYDGYPMKRLTIASQTWVLIDDDPYWYKQFHECQAALREWYIKEGGLYEQRMPPLIPAYIWDMQKGAFDLAKSIKGHLDPNNILNPVIYDRGSWK